MILTTNCLRFYEHELLEIFTNTNFSNDTNEPYGLCSLRLLLEQINIR